MFNQYSHLKSRLKRRHFFEFCFKMFGLSGVCFAIFMLFFLLISISYKGYKAFYTYYAVLDITVDNSQDLSQVDVFNNLVSQAINNNLSPEVNPITPDQISSLVSDSANMELADDLALLQSKNPSTESFRVKAKIHLNSSTEMFLKGYISSGSNSINENVLYVINDLKEKNIIIKGFNSYFFKNSDSRSPELAGIKGAFMGSIYTIFLTIIFSVIIGVGAAVYMEEFAKKNSFINLLEVNINNLAAVPSIVFGLLGLIFFQQFAGIPRSTPLLASFVLTLMALPTIIITTRLALSSVPNFIREAAYGLGSSKTQVIFKHILPISLPGILTGIIIAISRVIGETAPLLMIGMVAFINSSPSSITDVALVFPVQILLWFESPEIGYIEKASTTIMLLLIFLILINAISIYLRNKFEVKF